MNVTDNDLQGAALTVLPFVQVKRGVPHFWCVAPADNYAAACQKGREYAATLALYNRDNPGHAGLFARVVSAMDHSADGANNGSFRNTGTVEGGGSRSGRSRGRLPER